MVCTRLETVLPVFRRFGMTCAITTGKVLSLMETADNLTGAIFLSLTGCSSIHRAPLPAFLLPAWPPANHSAVPVNVLAGDFLPILFGQDRSQIAPRTACNPYANFDELPMTAGNIIRSRESMEL